MAILTYRQGDLFEALRSSSNKVVVPHVANTAAVMGAGFAATVREKYPNTNDAYVRYCKKRKLHDPKYYVPITIFTQENFGWFANMVCQTNLGGNGRNATYPDLVECMRQVVDGDYTEEIYAPKFGSGLCGLSWPFIEALIEDIWVASGFNVTVFTL